MSLTHHRPTCLRRHFQSAMFLVRVLYVSTDLRLFTVSGREAITLGRDVRQQDDDRIRIYRRLTLHYWVYLVTQMVRAEILAEEGKISPAALAAARQHMAFCDGWMERFYTQDQIRVALATGVAGYRPPLLRAA